MDFKQDPVEVLEVVLDGLMSQNETTPEEEVQVLQGKEMQEELLGDQQMEEAGEEEQVVQVYMVLQEEQEVQVLHG
jgi:hypothetical protein